MPEGGGMEFIHQSMATMVELTSYILSGSTNLVTGFINASMNALSTKPRIFYLLRILIHPQAMLAAVKAKMKL